LARTRGQRRPSLELPTWLVELVATEEQPAELEPLRGRFRRAGVDELLPVGDELAPDAIEAKGPALDVVTDVDTLVEGPLESGVIVFYARSFTGHARLGDRWLPPEGPDRDLHYRLMELRQHHAHADWTHTRTLVDTNAMLEIDGPPVLAEQRSRLSRDELEQIADLAERQHARFLEAAGWLKIELGVGNAPWWLVGDENRSEPE
jgi:hypothetical protein